MPTPRSPSAVSSAVSSATDRRSRCSDFSAWRWRWGLGASRPAAAALVAIGVVAVVITLASDFPESAETGAIGRSFEGARGSKGIGLYLELVAGVLAAGGGMIRLANPRR